LTAAVIIQAHDSGIRNFKVLSLHKRVMPALFALFSGAGRHNVDGLLCPGHVSAITGTDFYIPLVRQFDMPCVVGGFEPADIMSAVLMLVRQIVEGRAEVENAYIRVVSREGNKRALDMVYRVFRDVDTEWRGFGMIPDSGLEIREEFAMFDASSLCPDNGYLNRDPAGCRCGEILQGLCTPVQCPLFATRCTPLEPVGPCMVSGEGTCAAFFKYGERGQA
jgi:hydrogenase expression/formation protein HypD